MQQQRTHTSYSELTTWSTCRMKWYWAYELGIVPKRLIRAPSIGACGHVAIAAYLRGEDWREAIERWFVEETSKRELFDEEIAEYREIADLIAGIIPRYIDAYQDEFTPVLVEQRFEIPVKGMRLDLIGYWDAIVKDREGYLWILEHKFPKQRFRTDTDIELDGQIGIYQYAAHRLGYPVVGTIYNQLMARLPAVPKLNKDGSVSRVKIYTDWPTYRDFVVSQGLNPDDYSEMEEKLAEFKFFRRTYVFRPLVEIRLFARDLEHKVWDLSRVKKHIYRNASFMNCNSCPYRELCLESLKGGDVEFLIENEFEKKETPKLGGEEIVDEQNY